MNQAVCTSLALANSIPRARRRSQHLVLTEHRTTGGQSGVVGPVHAPPSVSFARERVGVEDLRSRIEDLISALGGGKVAVTSPRRAGHPLPVERRVSDFRQSL